MTRYLVLDSNNLVQRAVHVVKNSPDHREWMGRTYAIVFQSIIKMANKFVADHIVACFDSHSWREGIYASYKENRKFDTVINEKKAVTKRVSHMILREFVDYLRDKTNVTVLEGYRIEADDFIARWVQRHTDPFDSHIIVSNDADFKQLVRPAVDLYDPIPNVLYTSDGVYYQDDKRDSNHPVAYRYNETWKIRYTQPKATLVYRYNWDGSKKGQKGSVVYPVAAYPQAAGWTVAELMQVTVPLRAIRIVGPQTGWEYWAESSWMRFPVLSETHPLLLHPHDRIRFVQSREVFNPQWELFLKCIRGDTRDNIKPAFLRVPETRLRKAFADKEEYIKLINDSFGRGDARQDVRPLFEMNKKLIDLTAQPPDIIQDMDRVIDSTTAVDPRQMVELYFDKFCERYQNRRLQDLKHSILPIISRPYETKNG